MIKIPKPGSFPQNVFTKPIAKKITPNSQLIMVRAVDPSFLATSLGYSLLFVMILYLKVLPRCFMIAA